MVLLHEEEEPKKNNEVQRPHTQGHISLVSLLLCHKIAAECGQAV